jgi:hypothetical protein
LGHFARIAAAEVGPTRLETLSNLFNFAQLGPRKDGILRIRRIGMRRDAHARCRSGSHCRSGERDRGHCHIGNQRAGPKATATGKLGRPTHAGSNAMRQAGIKQSTPLNSMAQLAEEARRRARLLPPGKEREDLLRLARQSETTSHIEEWLKSPGLRAPS